MRKHHYKLQGKEEVELDITSFLNLMVVLVPFLLITAVFSRMAVIELNLPSSTSGPPRRRSASVRRSSCASSASRSRTASRSSRRSRRSTANTISRRSPTYMRSLKEDYSDVDAASVLVEPQIPYDYLIQVMDVVRSVDIPDETAENGFVRVALFPAIAVGEAP